MALTGNTPSGTAQGVPEQITLSRMKVPKASEVLAHELGERILSGEFVEGAGLPPERELVSQTGLSRTTVREALRILEVQGLIKIKAGRAGGAFIQRPGEQAMSNTVEDIIRGREISLPDLLVTRGAIEPHCARLAARSRTDAQLADLESANELLTVTGSTRDQIIRANSDWHIAVARASNNELLAGIMVALARAIDAAIASDDLSDGAVEKTAAAHRLITEAIAEHDEEAAVAGIEQDVFAHAHAQAV